MNPNDFKVTIAPELICQPVLDHGFVRYIEHMGSDQRIVESARVSYHQPSKGEEADKKLLLYLYKNKHTSPFEMVKLMLNIKLPIFVMRQYVRHRMQNLNEVSARYTELPNEFYIPKDWRKNLKAGQNKQQSEVAEFGLLTWFDQHEEAPEGSASVYTMKGMTLSEALVKHCELSYTLYQHMIRVGVARELARMVLPVNIYTECYVCWDLKNLLHFITLREDAHAQWEHQQYGTAIRRILNHLFPWTMEAFKKFKFPVIEMTETKE